MSLRYNWNLLSVEAHEIPKLTRTLLTKWKPTKASVDTETTGLDLVNDRAFYLSLAFIDSDGVPRACGVNIENANLQDLHNLLNAVYTCTQNDVLIGHNLPFDLNMLANTGAPITHKNVVDTMSIIRLATDAIQTKFGGAPLGLKEFAHRYLTTDATLYQKKLNTERNKIASALNAKLLNAFPPKSKAMWKELTETAKYPDAEDLPEPFKSIYMKWYEELPRAVKEQMKGMTVETKGVPYNMIDRRVLGTYAIYDAVFTYEIYDMLMPMLELRDQTRILELEKSLTYPLYMISREGFRINRDYVLETKPIVKNYLLKRQRDLAELVGADITHNQTKVLLEILQTKFGLVSLQSTNEEAFEIMLEKIYDIDPNHPAIKIIETVTELRGLSKFYGTYLKRFYRAVVAGQEFMYTSLNPSGTITGRFTSDFQQFPKEALLDNLGNELFHPRKLIIPHEGYKLLLIDYSQIELRIQALYTILLGNPDTNMCQAYMPYNCTHHHTRGMFRYDDLYDLSRWDEKQENGDSAWIMEDGTPWVPTDLHSKTTMEAYPHINPKSPEFKNLRSKIGKRANFACNYGAKAQRLKAMFHGISMEEARRIYQAYRDTFPGVIYFHQWCYETIAHQGYGENLFGRKYYNTTGHQFSNAAIQGTAADLLKTKVVELFYFLENTRTKMIMNVHDEIIFKLHPDELDLVPKIVNIMENVEGTFVPIVAEAEYSDTTWAEKKGFEHTWI